MTTPDYAGLIGWLQFFSQGDEKSPHARAAQAIRTLLESNAALEARLEKWLGKHEQQFLRAEAAEAERDRLKERVAALERVVERFEQHGCPDCSGDCSAANPPVLSCIMQEARAARSLVKGGKADG